MIGALALQASAEEMTAAINETWILTVTFLIFFMHAGFAMLESGQVRSKNVANQLTKNMLTWAVGVTVFFVLGTGIEALASGGGFAEGTAAGSGNYVNWLYGAVFAMTAATIVSGAVAGRAKLRAYMTYTFLLAAVIYPVITGFTWAAGAYGAGAATTGLVERLVGTPFADFAGGMIVHGMGGIAGLTAAAILGPRMDRYDGDGSVNVIPGHSMTFAVLGTLMLCFGWYGFNVGTAAAFDVGGGGANTLGQAAMTTTIAMAMGAVGSAAVALLRSGKVDTLYTANGMLAGLAAITAIPNTTHWWGAIIVGTFAGVQLPLVFDFVSERLGIDDVCAVFPVHGSAGVLGALLMPFVALPAAVDSVVNQFVAQFIGSPSMNVFPATVDGTALSTAGITVNVDTAANHSNYGELRFGIRPEDIIVSEDPNDGEAVATVTVVENLGSENILHLSFSDRDFVARVDERIHPSMGDEVGVTFPDPLVYLFDEDGQTIETRKMDAVEEGEIRRRL